MDTCGVWLRVTSQHRFVLRCHLGFVPDNHKGGRSRWRWRLSFAEVGDLAVAYRSDIAAIDEELHDLGAFSGQLGPARGGCRVLLEGADAFSGEFEIDLGQPGFCGALNRIGIVAEADSPLALNERLAPNGEHGVIEV